MPHKENRKIIRIGETSLGIILPKAWLCYFSLHAGEEVEIISNGQIIVKPISKNSNKQVLMEVTTWTSK